MRKVGCDDIESKIRIYTYHLRRSKNENAREIYREKLQGLWRERENGDQESCEK